MSSEQRQQYTAPAPEYVGAGPKHDALTIWRWCYKAVLALAKRNLEAANEAREGNEWPAGQTWGELGSSSHGVFLEQARVEAGIPHDEFLAIVRGVDEFASVASDEYARACGCSNCRADYPHLFDAAIEARPVRPPGPE